MDTSIQYHREMKEDDINTVSSIFIDLCNKYSAGIGKLTETPPGIRIIVNWVCIWNRPIRIGKEAVVIVSNNYFCMVQFKDGDYDFYRCEDVTPLPKPEPKLAQLT